MTVTVLVRINVQNFIKKILNRFSEKEEHFTQEVPKTSPRSPQYSMLLQIRAVNGHWSDTKNTGTKFLEKILNSYQEREKKSPKCPKIPKMCKIILNTLKYKCCEKNLCGDYWSNLKNDGTKSDEESLSSPHEIK